MNGIKNGWVFLKAEMHIKKVHEKNLALLLRKFFPQPPQFVKFREFREITLDLRISRKYMTNAILGWIANDASDRLSL